MQTKACYCSHIACNWLTV